MHDFKIKYNPVFPVIILICSVIIFITGLVLSPVSILTGALLLVLSIFMLTKPVVVFTVDEIQIKNMLGMTVKRYPYLASDVEIDEKQIRLNGKKIVGGILAKYDPQDLFDFIRNNKGSSKN